MLVEDEERHALHANFPRASIHQGDGFDTLVGIEQDSRRGGIEPRFPGDSRQHFVIADCAPFDEVGSKESLDQIAGIALRLSLRVASVREATEAEIGSGTAGTGFFRVQPLTPGHGTLH